MTDQGSESPVAVPATIVESASLWPDSRSPDRPADRRPRVLVVDDNADFADSLRMVLEIWSCEVAVAFDGLEALAIAHRCRPDIVLLDLGLPKLDGLQVARMLRRDPALRPLLLIAVTGFDEPGEGESSRGADFDHHLRKPIDAQRLRDLVSDRAPRS